MRRILLAILGLAVVFSSVSAEAQTKSKKSKKSAASAPAEDNSAAPDKVLYERAVVDVKKGRHEVGRLNLQTLINTYPDSEYLAKAKLLIADSYYKEGGSANLTQAIAGYKDFIVFFPFLPEAPYAQLQVANTHYKQMDKPDRDRTEAKAAEEEFQTFLAKYPKDPLVPKAEQRLREVQEILAEGDFRIGYYYYVKGDKRASAGRLLAITKRYPLYSRSDEALWMLGDIFEKSEKKEIASIYYQRIVRDYPLSGRVGDAKGKLVAFGVPVPQADPKALAWMQAEAAAPRPKPGMLAKPKALIVNGPDVEKRRSALSGTPQMEPESEGTSVADVLSGGGKAQIAAGGATGATGNTAIVEIVTPGSGASGGTTVEGGDTGGTAPATGGDANAPAPATDNQPATAPAAGSDTSAAPAAGAGQDGTAAPANGATPDPNAKRADANASTTADPKAESTSKKKKGLRKIIPW